jgi:predicted ATPase
VVHGETEEAIHAVLWEAVRAGLIFQQESTYKFLHYSAGGLFIDSRGTPCASPPACRPCAPGEHDGDQLAEHLFDVANQLNRGAALLVDRDEKVKVATIDLRAGRKAKASAAYASACEYFSAGMALLDESDWSSRYE